MTSSIFAQPARFSVLQSLRLGNMHPRLACKFYFLSGSDPKEEPFLKPGCFGSVIVLASCVLCATILAASLCEHL
jgi:hypothetical protein